MDRDAEYDRLVPELEEAGLAEAFTDDDGQQAIRLTPEGEKVTRQLAMAADVGQDVLMAALLGDAEPKRPVPRGAALLGSGTRAPK